MTLALLQAFAVVVSVGGLMGVIAAIRTVGKRRAWPPELSRKAVHVATGVFATCLPVFFSNTWPILLLCGLSIGLMLWMRLPGQRDAGLGSTLHSVRRRSWGDLFLALSIGFLFVQARGRPILFCLPMAVVTLSDSAAALAGSAYGRRFFTVRDGSKTWEGVAVFLIVTWLVAMVMLLLMTDVSRLGVVLLGLSVGVFGALVEAHSWEGLDNLFVPVGAFLYLHAYLDKGPASVAIAGFVFLAAIVAFTYGARALGMTAHAARVNGILVFAMASYAGWVIALPAIALILSHVVARRARPCRSTHPDLDLAAALAGAACLWVFVETTAGPSASGLFGLSCFAAAAAYACLAARARSSVSVLTVPAVTLAYVALAYVRGAGLGALPWAVASGAAAALAASLFPEWFDRWRAPRVIGAASVMPLVAYFVGVLP